MNDMTTKLRHDSSAHSRIAAARPVIRTDLFGYEPLGLVCAALFVAWVALMLRIVSIW